MSFFNPVLPMASDGGGEDAEPADLPPPASSETTTGGQDCDDHPGVGVGKRPMNSSNGGDGGVGSKEPEKKGPPAPNARKDANNKNSSRKKNGGNSGSSEGNGGDLKKLSHALSWALRHAAPELGLNMSPDGYVPISELLDCRHPKFQRKKGGGNSKEGNNSCDKFWTLEEVRKVVETNDKQRFKTAEKPAREYMKNTRGGDSSGGGDDDRTAILCIRANQGHSIKGIVDPDLLLARLSSDELASLGDSTVVHGTYREPWSKSICRNGLSKMKRNHIHFAPGLPDGVSGGKCNVVISGMRRSCDVYVYVDAEKCASDNVAFYRSDNGVLLTAGVGDSGILPVEYFSQVVDAKTGEILLDQKRPAAT